MLEALCQARALNSEDLTTVYSACSLILRNEVERLDMATYAVGTNNLVNVNLYHAHLRCLGIVEGVARSTTCRDILHIDVGDDHAVVTHEALTDTQHATELRDYCITRKHEVA